MRSLWEGKNHLNFFFRPPTLIVSNFEALKSTDSKFLAFKDLNLLKKHIKNQETSSILRVVFALSKSPHFHREFSNRPGMVVTVPCKKTRFFGHSLCKWGHFERVKTTLKMLLTSWFLLCFFKKFRCFIDENLGSVGQWAAKLQAIKLSEWLGRAGIEPEQTGWLGPGPAGRLFLETSNFDS